MGAGNVVMGHGKAGSLAPASPPSSRHTRAKLQSARLPTRSRLFENPLSLRDPYDTRRPKAKLSTRRQPLKVSWARARTGLLRSSSFHPRSSSSRRSSIPPPAKHGDTTGPLLRDYSGHEKGLQAEGLWYGTPSCDISADTPLTSVAPQSPTQTPKSTATAIEVRSSRNEPDSPTRGNWCRPTVQAHTER